MADMKRCVRRNLGAPAVLAFLALSAFSSLTQAENAQRGQTQAPPPGAPAPSTQKPQTRPAPAKPTAPTAQKAPATAKPAPARATRCDQLAAHPEDKGKTAPGVTDEELVPFPAIEACVAALVAQPKSGRFHFQLGRAYWAAEEYEDAVLAFATSEELGYAPAYFYLGLVFDEGLAGEARDAAAAIDSFLLGALGGFPPAARAYEGHASLEPSTEEEWKEFQRRRFVDTILKGDFQTLSTNDHLYFLAYLRGIEEFLAQNPNEYEPQCAGVWDAQLVSDLNSATQRKVAEIQSSGFIKMLEFSNVDLEPSIQHGTDDIYTLVSEYGGCGGAAVKKSLTNIKTYLVGVLRK